jgi:hypothetical protein
MMYAVLFTIEPARSQAHAPARRVERSSPPEVRYRLSPLPISAPPGSVPVQVGEERVAAQPGEQPDTAGQNGAGGAVEADRDALGEHLADGPGLAGLGSGGYQAVPVCRPSLYSENTNVNATSAWASPSVSMLIR